MRKVTWVPGLLFGLLLPAAGCHQNDDEAPVKLVEYEGPTVETHNVLMLMSDSARLRGRLSAPLEQSFESGDRVYPEGVRLTFLDATGQTVVNTITGKYGKFERNKNLYTHARRRARNQCAQAAAHEYRGSLLRPDEGHDLYQGSNGNPGDHAPPKY